MKIKVEYSESIEVQPGLWRKWGMHVDDESDDINASENIRHALKERVTRWHKEDNGGEHFVLANGNPFATPPTTINREAERVQIAIENAKTRDDLSALHDVAGKYDLLPLWKGKYHYLNRDK